MEKVWKCRQRLVKLQIQGRHLEYEYETCNYSTTSVILIYEKLKMMYTMDTNERSKSMKMTVNCLLLHYVCDKIEL